MSKVILETSKVIGEKLTKSTLSNDRFGSITRLSWTSFVDSSYPEFILSTFLQAVNGGFRDVTVNNFTRLPIFVEFALK